MYTLSDQQIDYILDDIRARGVRMERLQQNLLDHICCIIEQNLEENGDFEGFYARTIPSFYRKELCEIEDETHLLLTFKNYYTMKKILIVSGVVSMLAFSSGAFLKLFHFPGAAVLLLLGFLSFSFVFLPLLFIMKNREIGARRDKVILALGVLTGIFYCVSMLMQLMHWPGARVIWVLTLCLLTFIFIPVYFVTGIRKPETRMNTMVSSVMLVAVAGIQIALTSIRFKKAEPLPQPTVQQATASTGQLRP